MKTKQIVQSILVFSLISILYSLCSSFAFAQQVSLSVSPPLLETLIKPGKSIMVAYTFVNNGDPAIMKVDVLPFEPKGDNGHIRMKKEFDGPIRFSFDNADIEQGKPFFIRTRDSQQILLRIRIPEGTPPGDYYYTLYGETQPPPGIEGSTSPRAKVTIGSNIIITVTDSGRTEIKARVSLFDVIPRFRITVLGHTFNIFDSNDIVPLKVQIANIGKNFFKPQGQIVLRGNFGETAEYDIIPQNVLSESERLMLATPSAGFVNGSTLVLQEIFIGKYTLSANMHFGEGTTRLFASTTFYALPLKLGLALIVVFGVFYIILKKKRLENR